MKSKITRYYNIWSLLLAMILLAFESCINEPRSCQEYELDLIINETVVSRGSWPEDIVNLINHNNDEYFSCEESEFSTGILNVILFTSKPNEVKTGFDTKDAGGLNLASAKSRNSFFVKKWLKENRVSEEITSFTHDPKSNLYLESYLKNKAKDSHVFVLCENFLGDSLFGFQVATQSVQLRGFVDQAQCSNFKKRVYILYKPRLESTSELVISGANTARVGQELTYQVQGGMGPYSWMTNGSNSPTGNGESHALSYTKPGQFTIQVSDATGQITELAVVVSGNRPQSVVEEAKPKKEKGKQCDPEKSINAGIGYNEKTGVVTWNKHSCIDRVEIILTKTAGDCPELPSSQNKFEQKGEVGLRSITVSDGIHTTSSCKFKITLVGYNSDNEQLTLTNNTLNSKRVPCSKG